MCATDVVPRRRLGFWQGMFFLLVGIGLVLTVVRFTKGLGAVTNLSDQFPWGVWVGFDLLCGVGLAAGGFVLTAAVYIFHAERFRPIVRATVLTSFLCYILVSSALLIDLGRPWNIWHPLVMHNPTSVLFEVAWCVMLYSTVLALEFSGVIFEKLGWKRAERIQHYAVLPLVAIGVVLSTLHQSSLGSLYLIVPGKLHALWYSSLLPVLFWVSSVGVGLAMVIVASRLSARAFGRTLEMPLLSEIGRILVAVLGVYAVIRVFDLADRGVLALVVTPSYEMAMFHLEFALGVLAPIALLAFPAVRRSPRLLYFAALLAVLGFVANRLNVSITGFEGAQGGHYHPSLGEDFITLMLVALGFGGFALAVKYLNVYPAAKPERTAAPPRAVIAPNAAGPATPVRPRPELERHL